MSDATSIRDSPRLPCAAGPLLHLATGLLVASTACGRVAFDVVADADSSDDDAADLIGECIANVDGDTVALYTFDGALGADSSGNHPGTVRMNVTQTPGRCGSGAARFDTGYILVPDSPELDLATGSIELFAHLSTTVPPQNEALITRDADGSAVDGHFTILVTPGNELISRLQIGGLNYYRCAAGFPRGRWVHIGLSFGGSAQQGYRLWLDHAEAVESAATLAGSAIDCTGTTTAGIAGTDNTLVIGGSNARSTPEGTTDPTIDQYVLGGELDHIHIRSSWRAFSAR